MDKQRLTTRVSMRLKHYDYSQNGLYFITICVNNMDCLFGSISNDAMQLNKAGNMMSDQWLLISKRFKAATLHEFVVMPNHFHAIIELSNQSEHLSDIIGAFKSITTNAYINGVKSRQWKEFDQLLWQRSFYDKIIRNENFHHKVIEYINHNPAKWCDDKYYQ